MGEAVTESTTIEYGRLVGVPAFMAEENWGQISPFIERVIKKMELGDYLDPEDILESINRQDMQLWIVPAEGDKSIDAVIVTQILSYPKCRVFDLYLVAGDNMRSWVHEAMGILKGYGRSEGCKFIRGFGREGWVKIFEDTEELQYHALWDLKL